MLRHFERTETLHVQEDKALQAQVDAAKLAPALVLDLQPTQPSLDLWEEMCSAGKGVVLFSQHLLACLPGLPEHTSVTRCRNNSGLSARPTADIAFDGQA